MTVKTVFLYVAVLIALQALLASATSSTNVAVERFLGDMLNITEDNIIVHDPEDYPTCDGCFCVPEPGESCPSNVPQTNFSTLTPILQAFTWTNSMSLECNPYEDEACDTNPPLEQGGACVVDITPNEITTCPTDWSYETRTYAGSYEEALNEGLYVTHARPCGTCSSLQDLAAYMITGASLQGEASKCGIRGLLIPSLGIECFLDLGFTEGCANIWFYNVIRTREFCGRVCTVYTVTGEGSNGPPPNCSLAECINCDEVNSGAIFKQFAGRARRNSGLLSGIVRNCSEVIPLQQENPCEFESDGTPSSVVTSCGFMSGSFLLASFLLNVLVVIGG